MGVKELPETLESSREQWQLPLTSEDLERQRGQGTRAVRAEAGHDIPFRGHLATETIT